MFFISLEIWDDLIVVAFVATVAVAVVVHAQFRPENSLGQQLNRVNRGQIAYSHD